ncbi:MAG: hypothetical protein HOP36_02620 [Methyloglobulus sp.]|nr:hypothetical protein [Methyloglobulus sp.]
MLKTACFLTLTFYTSFVFSEEFQRAYVCEKDIGGDLIFVFEADLPTLKDATCSIIEYKKSNENGIYKCYNREGGHRYSNEPIKMRVDAGCKLVIKPQNKPPFYEKLFSR